MSRKLYDSFLFSFEVDILKLRLAELSPWVDKFILVEANKTFSGLEKEMVWQQVKNDPCFAPYINKIIYIPILEFPPRAVGPWEREAYQRMSIIHGVGEMDSDDVLLISDCDEIPNLGNKDTMDTLQNMSESDWIRFVQTVYIYTPHWRYTSEWHGTSALTKGLVANRPESIQHARVTQSWSKMIDPGGWSFTYFGGTDLIQRKIASYSHTEDNLPQYTNTEHIDRCIQEGQFFTGRDNVKMVYEEFPDLPSYMYKHPDVYGVNPEYAKEKAGAL